MNLRGRILNLSLEHHSAPFVFICTDHQDDVITIVPAAPGTEGMLYTPQPFDEIGDNCARLHGTAVDHGLVEQVKYRVSKLVDLLSRDSVTKFGGELYTYASSTLTNARINLERLRSLDGNLPIEDDDPEPFCCECVRLSPPIETQSDDNLVGKIAFIEIPIGYGNDITGEYLITANSPDSLYGVAVNSDTLELTRIAKKGDGDEIAILYSHFDKTYLDEFLTRMDDIASNPDNDDARIAGLIGRQLRSCLSRPTHPMADVIDAIFTSIGAVGEPLELPRV